MYSAFDSLKWAILILLNVAIAPIGGLFALYFTGAHFSVSSGIGFLALFGVSVQVGVILIEYINQLRASGHPLMEAVMEGAVARLRPIINDQALGFLTQVPLFLYNNQRAGVVQADAQRKAAEALLRQAERQAATDVAKAYAAYLAARQSMSLYSADNLIQMRRVQDITQFSFEQGNTSLFELLEVQRSSQQAFIAFNQARANYQVSLWQLEQAVGTSLF